MYNWDKFWQSRTEHLGPSSFAKKVLPELHAHTISSLVDMGSGNGRDAIFFAKSGVDVLAMDSSKQALEQLKAKAEELGLGKSVSIQRQNITSLSLAKESLEAIYSRLTLQYFSEKETTHIFSEIIQAMKSGGLLCLELKSTQDKTYGTGKEIEPGYFRIGDKNLRFFSPESLSRLLPNFAMIHIEEYLDSYTPGKEAILIHLIAQKP